MVGPRHSFWSVLGPAEPPKFGTGTRAARGGVNPAEADSKHGSSDTAILQVKAAILSDILGEATRLGNRAVSLFAPIRADCGLSGIELLTLIAIVRSSAPPTVPHVGRALGHPRQVIQRAVRVLEERGLVEALPNPGHKRAGLLVVTEKGREAACDIGGQAMEIVMGVVEGLEIDAETLRTMLDTLQTLRRRIDDRLVGSGLSASGAE